MRTTSDVHRLAAARVISVTGGSAAQVALVFQVFEQTGSAKWTMLAMLATTGAQSVFLPFAGALGDRWPRRRIMIGSDLAAALTFAVLAVGHPPAQLIALAVVATLAETPFLPASAAAIANLAGPDGLSRANGIYNTGTNIGRTVGALAAGGLYAVAGPNVVFGLNAASFLVSALIVAGVRMPPGAVSGDAAAPTGVTLHIRRHPGLRLLLISSAGAWVTTSFAMVAEPSLAAEFGVGAAGYGLMTAAWGTGLIAGSSLAGRFTRADNEPAALLLGRLVMGSGILLVAASPWFALIPVLMVLGGAGSGALGVAMFSQLQRHTDDRLRSRVFAGFESIGTLSFLVGILLAGPVVTSAGARPAIALAGLGTLATAVPLYLNVRRTRAGTVTGAPVTGLRGGGPDHG